ncbi:MAG: hypothetical protein A3K18_28285 [Lentisphaerae bacterium RIFOXYA12_64_32]|nr:MAG: hypothetical protein A3K18_28285 [Lentisphaerae bacterium RIFOXYA12_64_32]
MNRGKAFAVVISLAVAIGLLAWMLWLRSANRSYSSVGPGYIERSVAAYFYMFKRYPRNLMESEYQRLFPETQELVVGRDPGREDTFFVASAKSARAKRTYFHYEYKGEKEPPVVKWVPPPANSDPAQ